MRTDVTKCSLNSGPGRAASQSWWNTGSLILFSILMTGSSRCTFSQKDFTGKIGFAPWREPNLPGKVFLTESAPGGARHQYGEQDQAARVPPALRCRSARARIQTALGNVRSHTADTTAAARRYRRYQGRICGNGSSPVRDQTESA